MKTLAILTWTVVFTIYRLTHFQAVIEFSNWPDFHENSGDGELCLYHLLSLYRPLLLHSTKWARFVFDVRGLVFSSLVGWRWWHVRSCLSYNVGAWSVCLGWGFGSATRWSRVECSRGRGEEISDWRVGSEGVRFSRRDENRKRLLREESLKPPHEQKLPEERTQELARSVLPHPYNEVKNLLWIEKNEVHKKALEDWERKGQLLTAKVERKKKRSSNLKNEVYQVIGFFSVFQEVVLTAVS